MKVLGWIIGLALLLIVGIGVFVVMNSGSLIEAAIEEYGTAYLGAPVAVDGVDVSLAEGSAGIRGLEIGNPAGFSGPAAFQLGQVAVTLDTENSTSEVIVLKQVVIDGANLAALAQGRETNLKRLMDNLEANLGSGSADSGESQIKLIIDKFDFTNAEASVDSDLLGQAMVDIPDVHLTDIGRRSNGATIGEALQQVMQPIYRAVTRALASRGVDLEGARERLEQGVRERGQEALEGGLESLRDRLRRPDESPR